MKWWKERLARLWAQLDRIEGHTQRHTLVLDELVRSFQALRRLPCFATVTSEEPWTIGSDVVWLAPGEQADRQVIRAMRPIAKGSRLQVPWPFVLLEVFVGVDLVTDRGGVTRSVMLPDVGVGVDVSFYVGYPTDPNLPRRAATI